MWTYSLLILNFFYGLLCLYCAIYQRPACLWKLLEKKYRGKIGRVYFIVIACFLIVGSFLYMFFLAMGLLPFHS